MMAAKFDQRTAIAHRAIRRRVSLGATMTEYALLLVAVLIIATAVFKTIRPSVNCNGMMSVGDLPGSEGASSDCGGGNATASMGGTSDLGGSVNNYGGGSSDSSGGATASGGSASSGGSSSASDGSSNASSSASNTFSGEVAGTAPKAIDLTLAKLADDTYNDTPKGADGFTAVSQADLDKAGISSSMLQDDSSGFRAVVYTDGKGDYVVAYRGTDNGAGWVTDAKQGLGQKTAQYSETLALAKAAKAAWGNNVVLTGHSLGGGEAAAAAAGTGLSAVTFNAAGVNDNTLTNEGKDPAAARDAAYNGQVRNYEVQGEALSTAQNKLAGIAPQAMGRTISVADPHPMKTALYDSFGPVGGVVRSAQLHLEFVQGMEKNPVTYQGADGQPAQYSFSNPNNPRFVS
jgi:hypothetical protein